MPTSAAASAGASLTPSPTMATGPCALRKPRDVMRPCRAAAARRALRRGRPRRECAAALAVRSPVSSTTCRRLQPRRRRRSARCRPRAARSVKADDAERRAAVADEHGRGAARLDLLDARVQRRRAELPIFEQPMAADDGGRRGHGRLGAEPRQGAEALRRGRRRGRPRGRGERSRGRSDARTAPRARRQPTARRGSSAPSTPRTSVDRDLRVGQRAGLVERDAA